MIEPDAWSGPTNKAGLTTLFGHRAWRLWCRKHDRQACGGDVINWCPECESSYAREWELHRRQQRISEMREALRPLVKDAIRGAMGDRA